MKGPVPKFEEGILNVFYIGVDEKVRFNVFIWNMKNEKYVLSIFVLFLLCKSKGLKKEKKNANKVKWQGRVSNQTVKVV